MSDPWKSGISGINMGPAMQETFPNIKPDHDSLIEELNVSQMGIDEGLWGEGAEIVLREFLLTSYDPKRMPLLAAADVKGREGTWLLGWENDGTDYPPLLVYLFGQEYADMQLDRITLRKKQPTEHEHRFGMTDAVAFVWRAK
jgi:hypothetical protein